VRLPLLLMNSEATQRDTAEALKQHPELDTGLPVEFMQSMIPKLEEETLEPAAWPQEPSLEWAPPGHGDVYGALRRSGVLEQLLEAGVRFAMISNSDNLGALVEPRIPAYMSEHDLPFLMEVVLGTEADRKGGHLARRHSDGQIVLRESAQVPPEDEESFRDYRRWRYYNTNNLWVDLRALDDELEHNDGVLELSLIVNHKTVDPRDADSTPVIQLESAMGSAIQSFPGAQLLCVPRTRFVPVKTTNDLLVLRSDVYRVSDGMIVKPVPERAERLPYVDLDNRFYKVIDKFEARFPAGSPSLREAERLVVGGDVTFGADVVVRGDVELEVDEPTRIEDGTVLGG
jgi:UTP--glucose-1-phosphate uridylyltransferase